MIVILQYSITIIPQPSSIYDFINIIHTQYCLNLILFLIIFNSKIIRLIVTVSSSTRTTYTFKINLIS